MSDWEHDVETPDVKAWKEEARTLQQNMYLRLGDREWDQWDRLDKTILLQKVGFGLYPLPKNNLNAKYTKKQFKNIKLLADVILENAKNGNFIYFACIFIFGKIKDDRFFIQVFKVKGKQNQTLFVDTDRHIYEKWQDYLNSNRLPKCVYCYPRDGLYQGEENQVLIDFGTSPACDPKSGIFSIYGTTTEVTFATSFIMTSLFPAPITTPISEAMHATSDSTGLYDTPQNATNLEETQFQDQRVGLNESEEKMDRSRMIKIALSMAQDRTRASITQAAAAGDVKTKHQKITQHVNAVVTLTDFLSLVDKADKNTPTEGDVRYFSAYFLFYSHQVLKRDTVGKIIKNTQQKVLNCHCDDLTDQQIDEFLKLSENVEGISQLHKNARTIKAINRINYKQAFYGNLAIARRELENHHVQFSFNDPGLVNIDNELHIAPSKLIQISETDRQQILEATQKIKSHLNNAGYRKNIEKILQDNRVKMEYQRREAIAQLKKSFNANNLKTAKIGDEQIFKNMTPSELDRLANVMEVFSRTYDSRMLKIVNEFAKMRHCKTPRDYCNYIEFIATYVNELKRQKEGEYMKALNDAESNKDFDRNRFDSEYGIKGKRTVQFTNQVIDYFETNPEESFSALEKLYNKIESGVQLLNENADPNFASIASAVSHYFKHKDFGGTHLTPEEYFNVAAELVSEPLNRRSATLNQQGDKMMITFENPINGAKGVLFETLADGTQSLATVFYDKKVLNQPD